MTFKADSVRTERAGKDRAWLAWHVAALSKCDPKKFPKLEDVMGERPAARVQTPEEMKAVFASMRARRQ